jgi:hypothetical protein
LDETTIVTGAFDQMTRRVTETYATCSSTTATVTYGTERYGGKVVTRHWARCKTPGFHKILKRGGLLPYNQYDVSTETEERKLGTIATHYQLPDSCTLKEWLVRQTHGMVGDWPFTLEDPGIDGDVLTGVVNAAVAQARSNIFDALTFLAEFEQTKRMFRDSVHRIGDFGAKAAGKANRHSRKTRRYAFHQYWLEYRYGWLPLLYSMRDLLDVIRRGQVIREFGHSTQETTFTDTRQETEATAPNEDVTWNEQINITRVYRGWASATCSPFFVPRGGVDPLVTSWEVLPYSFVIDWFIPIGTWLQAVSPLQPGSVSGSGGSVRTTLSRRLDASVEWHRPAGSSTDHWGTGFLGEHLLDIESYTRIPMGVSLPGWNPRISPVRMLDAVSLLLAQKARVFRLLRK